MSADEFKSVQRSIWEPGRQGSRKAVGIKLRSTVWRLGEYVGSPASGSREGSPQSICYSHSVWARLALAPVPPSYLTFLCFSSFRGDSNTELIHKAVKEIK